MATKKKTRKSKAKKAPAKKVATRGTKKAAAKKAAAKKAPAKKAALKPFKKVGTFQVKKALPSKANKAVKEAAEALWSKGVPPHELLRELHEVLLLRCLDEAEGNYAGAASLFGPSRQSVQQYANSQLRDTRWKSYQQNRRKKRASAE